MVRRSSIAACVTCGLCGGFLHDATAISECLHTFCRECIVDEITNKNINHCPKCSIDLGCDPLAKLRADRSLQCISSVILPAKHKMGMSSGSSGVAGLAQSSQAEASTTLMRLGHDPYQWGGPRLTWSDRSQPEATPIFVLDDAKEQEEWDRMEAGLQSLKKILSSVLSTLHDDLAPAHQALYDQSRMKSELLRRRLSEEAQRTAAAEARLVEAKQRMANLSGEVTDLRVRHQEAVADAEEAEKKLSDLVERTREDEDEEEAQKVKAERDELLRAARKLQSVLGIVRHDRERALRERDQACQECIIARKERDDTVDKRLKIARGFSWFVKENSRLKPEVQSLRAAVAQARERDLARSQEIEGLKSKLVGTEAELATERREHSELRTAAGSLCDALGSGEVGSLLERLGAAFERARALVKEALHVGVWRTFAVFRSHYEIDQQDLEVMSEGYHYLPEEELDAIDEEVREPAKALATGFEDEVVLPPPLNL